MMKKLLLVFAFAFFGQQAFSQMYIVMITSLTSSHISGCWTQTTGNATDRVITIINPAGIKSYTCLQDAGGGINTGGYQDAISTINQEFNTIISQGYKMVHISDGSTLMALGGTWYFAIP